MSGTAEDFEIRKDVRQRCILSLMLSNLYMKRAFIESISDSPIGLKMNGIAIKNIGYANDTVILEDSANFPR